MPVDAARGRDVSVAALVEIAQVATLETEPRKRPRQARSQVLYDALVEATQQLVVEPVN